MLVIYDNKGTVYFAGTGYPEPEGLQHMNVETPEGKYFRGIDVSVVPHQPVFEDIPKSGIEILQEKVEQLEVQNEALLKGL